MGIVIGILILSLMMFLHELGHYLTGRRLGFTIEEFSIFMGPVLYSWTRNNIKYSIKMLPIGASVRFAGEYGDDETPKIDDPGRFFSRPKWARSIVIGTGPVVNLLSGVLALALMFSIFGYTVPVLGDVSPGTLAAHASLVKGDQIIGIEGHVVNTVIDYAGIVNFINPAKPLHLEIKKASGEVVPVILEPETRERYRLGITIKAGQADVIDSVDAASNGGNPVLLAGDKLLAVNGIPFEKYDEFVNAVETSAGKTITITVSRNGETKDLEMVATKYNDPVALGISFQGRNEFFPAIGQAFQWPWSIIKLTLRSFGMLFAGTIKPQDALSGPVGVVTYINDVVTVQQPLSDKIQNLLWLFALVSVSLGFMNLLPIPPLDGYHLVLIVVEAIRRKRLTIKTQNIIGIIGIGVIVLLAVAGLVFDIMRLVNR
jgi:regulator of sigma E protease